MIDLCNVDLYRDSAVRERIREFVGSPDGGAGAAAIRSVGSSAAQPQCDLPRLLRSSAEIERSLWDDSRILADLDVEYVNQDFPAEPFLDPHRSFALQRPVVRAIQEALGELGIFPLHVMSGRGHHFVWSVAKGSRADQQLQEVGSAWARVEHRCRRSSAPDQPPLALEQAFVGLGMTLEWLAQRAIERSSPESQVSVQLTDVRVGSGRRGRECVSIDLSEYGDPLSTRYLRAPYTYYRKPRRRPDLFGRHVASRIPDLVCIPVFEMGESEAIAAMRDPAKAVRLAKRAPGAIPDASAGTARLVEGYRRSELARFHRRHYAANVRCQRAPDALPPCAERILRWPNDLLLQPVGLQHIVRVLLALGWEPRGIAALIQRKFEEDHAWGERWKIYDPARRADFYTRLFAGAIVTGTDRMVDLNSVSHIEKGCCAASECQCDLSVYRRSLEERLTHERLGRRPFNRLFSA